MGKTASRERCLIHPEMRVLDVVSSYRETEEVFRKYDGKAGECICCQALFEPLGKVAARYGIDLERLLSELETAAKRGS